MATVILGAREAGSRPSQMRPVLTCAAAAAKTSAQARVSEAENFLEAVARPKIRSRRAWCARGSGCRAAASSIVARQVALAPASTRPPFRRKLAAANPPAAEVSDSSSCAARVASIMRWKLKCNGMVAKSAARTAPSVFGWDRNHLGPAHFIPHAFRVEEADLAVISRISLRHGDRAGSGHRLHLERRLLGPIMIQQAQMHLACARSLLAKGRLPIDVPIREETVRIARHQPKRFRAVRARQPAFAFAHTARTAFGNDRLRGNAEGFRARRRSQSDPVVRNCSLSRRP